MPPPRCLCGAAPPRGSCGARAAEQEGGVPCNSRSVERSRKAPGKREGRRGREKQVGVLLRIVQSKLPCGRADQAPTWCAGNRCSWRRGRAPPAPPAAPAPAASGTAAPRPPSRSPAPASSLPDAPPRPAAPPPPPARSPRALRAPAPAPGHRAPQLQRRRSASQRRPPAGAARRPQNAPRLLPGRRPTAGGRGLRGPGRGRGPPAGGEGQPPGSVGRREVSGPAAAANRGLRTSQSAADAAGRGTSMLDPASALAPWSQELPR